jgi:hypothetical protein
MSKCCNCIFTLPGCYNICEPILIPLEGIEDGTYWVDGGYYRFQATATDGVLTIPSNTLNESDCAVLSIEGYQLEADGKTYDCIKFKTVYSVAIQAGGFVPPVPPEPTPPPSGGCDCTVEILVPNYLAFPDLDPVNPQSVNDGDIVIHGGFQWINDTGGVVVPTVVDEFTLTGLTQMARTSANNYVPINAYVETAADIGEPQMITRVRVPIINHLFEVPFNVQDNSYLDPFTTMIGFIDFGNVSLAFDKGNKTPVGIISNNIGTMTEIHQAEIKLNGGQGKVDRISGFASFVGNVIEGLVQEIKGGRYVGNEILGSSRLDRITANSNFLMEANQIIAGSIDAISAIAGESEMKGNVIDSEVGGIGSMVFNSARVNNNIITGGFAANRSSQIAFCVLNDNCEVNGNELTGDGTVIWDIQALENSKVNENILSGEGAFISAIKMADFDEITNCELIGFGAFMSNINMEGGQASANNNRIDSVIIRGGAAIANGRMAASEIKNCDFTTGGSGIIAFELRGSVIENAVGLVMRRIHLRGAQWDLTGYATNILHHNYDLGKGYFQVDSKEIVAGTLPKPTTEDVTVFYNIIPKGHRVTRVYLQGDNLTGSAGAQLEISCDGEVIASHPLATYNSADGVVAPNGGPFDIGKVLTVNAPIALTARNNDITGGDFVLVVEYVKGE